MELLAPAGNYEGFLGAIHAGADAVYLGGEKFGARAYADNFTGEEICRAICYAHIFGRKVYLTVNTLIKESEFHELLSYLEPFYKAGLDGVIVQDLGALLAIRSAFPALKLHASTQMTLTGYYGAAYLKELGAVRIVPARELSLEEIGDIRNRTGLELETFVHGAMCYCYSGQCLFSSILGGRSGNRGRCAQPCRLPYRIAANKKAGKEQYPLSLKDMCTISFLPKLLQAGITSFKIEGRMKKPEYTAGVTSLYRKYIDLYYEKGADAYRVSGQDLKKLNSLYIRSQIQEGYYFRRNGTEMLTMSSPAYNGNDERLLASIRKQYLEEMLKQPVIMHAVFKKGESARLTVECPARGHTVTVEGEAVAAADNRPITEDNIKKGLLKLGNTAFCARAEDISILAEDGIFYSLKAVNELRRKGIEALEKTFIPIDRKQAALQKLSRDSGGPEAFGQTKGFRILVSTEEQLQAVLEERVETDILYLESDMPGLSGKTLYACRQNPYISSVLIALPPILRKQDMEILNASFSLLQEADGCLVRNLEALSWLHRQNYAGRVLTDAGIYCFNKRTLTFLKKQAAGFCLPYELNQKEIRQLLDGMDASGAEQVVYGRIPLMVTANCIAKTNGRCVKGGPADKYALKDRYGKDFPVAICCRHCYNIIYNSLPLSLHEKLFEGRLKAAPRLQFTVESGQETRCILRYFADGRQGTDCRPPYEEYTLGHERRGVE